MNSSVVDSSGSIEGINCSLSGLVVFPFDHGVDVFELIIDLLEYNFVLIIENFLILFHLDVHMFYSLQLFLQNSQVIFIVSRYVGDWIFARNYSMIFVDCASVNTVDAEQFELVLAVESDEIVMD